MTIQQKREALKEMTGIEVEKLSDAEVETTLFMLIEDKNNL